MGPTSSSARSAKSCLSKDVHVVPEGALLAIGVGTVIGAHANIRAVGAIVGVVENRRFAGPELARTGHMRWYT